MKRRYGLESIIGKNSSLRFPRLVSIEEPATINCILPANTDEIETTFNTALTMKNADPEEAYEQFNDISCEYDDEFPIRVKVTVQGPLSSIEVLDPTIFSLINITFDLDDYPIEKLHATVTDILVVTTNFALIKQNADKSYFLSDLITNIRTILNNMKSYNNGRKKLKLTTILTLKARLQRYLLNIKSHFNKSYYHKRLYYFCFKVLNKQNHEPIHHLIDQIEYFYDLLDDWDDAYDFAWLDQYLYIWDCLLEYTCLAEKYACNDSTRSVEFLLPSDNYVQISIDNITTSLSSRDNLDLLDSFKVSFDQP